MRPEEKLILHFCGNNVDLFDSFTRELINEIKDWDYFVERSIDTLLAPLIWKRLRLKEGLEFGISAHVVNKLHQAYCQIFAKNAFLYKFFQGLSMEFEKRDISVIPLKGIFLLENYYQDFGLRQISDIDLLVREESLGKVCNYFIDNGFEMEMYMPALAAKVSKTPAPFKFSKDGIVIDLHIGLTYVYDNCQFNIDLVWCNSAKSLKGYSTMNSMDHALYLCAHLIKHFDYRNCKLINFYDLILVLQKDQIECNELLNYSRLFGFERDIWDIFYLLKKHFSFEGLPSDWSNFRPTRPHLDDYFTEILSTSRTELERKYSPEGSTGFKPLLSLSFTNQLKYLFSRVFPDVSYLRTKYGKKRNTDMGRIVFHFKTLLFQVFSSPKV